MNKFQRYHSEFQGDTYEVCARCGGKCEKFKISTLMPGEKDHLSLVLGINQTELDEQYLSRINLPGGTVEVLKMADGCRFLDSDFRCSAIAAKPVLCDTYPIIFYKYRGNIHFRIDTHDCPMVHLPEFKRVVRDFRSNGVAAISKFAAGQEWWDLVVIYDEFDYNFQRMEQELGDRSRGFYFIEEVMGFACNGYEARARKRGLDLLKKRFIPEADQMEERSFQRILNGAKKDIDLLTSSDNTRYLAIVRESLDSIRQTEHSRLSLSIQPKPAKPLTFRLFPDVGQKILVIGPPEPHETTQHRFLLP